MCLPGSVVGDMHVCPLVTGVVPHVGGAIPPPGVPTVLAMNRPAVPAPGNTCICVGPPAVSAKGSGVTLIQNRMWARIADTTAHGGTVTGPGAMTVLVGG
ncbi:MAG: PAAR domain-containing protein [Pseudomonadota bacterium]